MALNQYPLDPSGVSVNNLVRGETVTVPTTGLRVLCLRFGAFFAASLKIKDVASNTLLRPDQFHAAYRYKVPTSIFKKDVCGLIVIDDPGVGDTLQIDYQVVGGIYSGTEDSIVAMLKRRAPQNRPAMWRSLLGRLPSVTLKDFTDDKYGFARLENALNDVARLMVNGNAETQDALYNYTDTRTAPYTNNASPDFAAELAAHIAKADPHPYYLRKNELATTLPKVFAAVRRPKNFLPGDRATGVALKPALEGSAYRALYGVPQGKMQVQVATDGLFAKLVLDQTTTGVSVKYTLPVALTTKTKYFWRVRYQNTEAQWSEWSYTTSFTTV